DRKSFSLKKTFMYSGQGWGLTKDQTRIILSDGTATLRYFDPKTLMQNGTLNVTDQGRPVTMLNELEYINGEIWANVWQSDRIARISPFTGNVVGWIDLKGLLTAADKSN